MNQPTVDGDRGITTESATEGEPERDTQCSSSNPPADVIFFVSAGFDAMMDDGFGTENLDAAWYCDIQKLTISQIATTRSLVVRVAVPSLNPSACLCTHHTVITLTKTSPRILLPHTLQNAMQRYIQCCITIYAFLVYCIIIHTIMIESGYYSSEQVSMVRGHVEKALPRSPARPPSLPPSLPLSLPPSVPPSLPTPRPPSESVSVCLDVPMVFNLEGGYNPTNVVKGMESVLEALSVPQGSAEWERDYYT